MSNNTRAHKVVATIGVGAILAGGAVAVAASQSTASRKLSGDYSRTGAPRAYVRALVSRAPLSVRPHAPGEVYGFHVATSSLRTVAINPRLRRSFRIFRHRPLLRSTHAASAETSAFESEVPLILRHWLVGGAATILGQADSQNAEILNTSSGVPLLVLAGPNGVCLAAPTGGYVATCGPVGTVTGGLGLQLGRSSEMVGIVPDGNSSVTATLASGQTIPVPVTSNAFAISATSPPVKITYKTATGAPAFQQGDTGQ